MYLDQIIATKHSEVALLKKNYGSNFFESKISDLGPRDIFFNSLKFAKGYAIIGEIKKASPSKGLICQDFNPTQIAATYTEVGINAISVLTDQTYFQGSLDIFDAVRQTTQLPLLRKDFIIDEIQILEAKAHRAEAVLLIERALSGSRFKILLDLCRNLNMEALVEVHSLDGAKHALDCGARTIGINNRDLQTFKVDLNISAEILPSMPESVLRISESGIETHQDISFLKKAGADAFLIGTSFMKETDKMKKYTDLTCEN